MGQTKAVIVRIVLKGNPDKIPDFGLGKGVIKEAVVDIDENEDSALGSWALSNLVDKLMKESVGYTIEPYTEAN
jgi:hypothetical protein